MHCFSKSAGKLVYGVNAFLRTKFFSGIGVYFSIWVLIFWDFVDGFAECVPVTLFDLLSKSFVKAFVETPEKAVWHNIFHYVSPEPIKWDPPREGIPDFLDFIEEDLENKARKKYFMDVFLRHIIPNLSTVIFKVTAYVFYLPFPDYVKARSPIWAMLQTPYFEIPQRDYTLTPRKRNTSIPGVFALLAFMDECL